MRVFKNLFGNGDKIDASEIALSKTSTVAGALARQKENLGLVSPFKEYNLNEPYIELMNGTVFIKGAVTNTRELSIEETNNSGPIRIATIPKWAWPSRKPNGGTSAVRSLQQGSATSIFLLSVESRGDEYGLFLARYRASNSSNFTPVNNGAFLIIDISYPAE